MRPFPLRFPRATLAPLAFVGAAAAALGGCGHPATEAECDEIINKVVELELAGPKGGDAGDLAKRSAEARTARGAELRQRCLSRNIRVTDKSMACLRSATSFDQIENDCLR
jgi:hypothetical protein